MIGPLLFYFLPRVKNLTLIDQPYPGSDILAPRIEKYRDKKMTKLSKAYFSTLSILPLLIVENKPGTRISFKIRDFLSVLEVGLTSKENYDLFIGLESINTLAGILLRKLGKVKRVAYYVSDYSPYRYPSKIFNSIYLWLDRFCAMHADFIWDVSPAMQPARIKVGLDSEKSAPVIPVPNALYKEQIGFLPLSKRDPHSLVFVGTLGLENGPDLAVEAVRLVVKKFPLLKLHIFGGGGQGFERKLLEELTRKYKLQNNVVFHNFIDDQKLLSETIQHFEIALAPYKITPRSVRLYGDATKIRLYLAAGLPVITTRVPPLGKIVAEKGAAAVVPDNATSFAKEVICLLENRNKREKMSKKAYALSIGNTWEDTYGGAMRKMKLYVSAS
jgi:glycosyltransferase involved in cell wall biosynthesis